MPLLITPVSVTGTGTYTHNEALIIDGIFPGQGTGWTSAATVYWNGPESKFEIDYGALFTIEDVTLSVDNNDSYLVEFSQDGAVWSSLFTVDIGDGEITWGMDTMTSMAGEAEYVSGIDFEPVEARYLRIMSVGGDNMYSVGEIQAYGTGDAPVPEPSTLLLFGAGAAGMAFISRKTEELKEELNDR